MQRVISLYMFLTERERPSLGIWDWDDVENKVVELDSAPAAAKLAAEIISSEKIDAAWEATVLKRTRLPQLSLIEWSISDEVASIFEVLRNAGSQHGFVVEQGEAFRAKNYTREIVLSAETAEQIERDLAMDFPMAFVDEQRFCFLVSYFSDYALISLREDLFRTWLEARSLDLTMWADAEPYPVANDLKTARELALRRSADWDAHWKEKHSN